MPLPAQGPTGATPGPADEEALAARLRAALAPGGVALGELARRCPLAAGDCLVGVGAVEMLVRVRDGLASVQADLPLLARWDFSIRGSARGWAALWQPFPPPGWHDLFALARHGEFRIEGNLLPFMANLQYFKDLLALPREVQP